MYKGRGKLHPVGDLNQSPNGTCFDCADGIHTCYPVGVYKMVFLSPVLDILVPEVEQY